MPRISSINKKSKKTKDFFANRISASEDTDTVFEQSEALAKKIKEDKENEINAAIKTSLSFAVPKEKINNNKLKNSFLTKKQSRQSSPNPLPVKKDPPSNDKTTDITADTSADKTKENKNIFSHKTHKNPRLTTDISADNFFQTNNLTTIEESPLLSPSPTQKDTSLSKKEYNISSPLTAHAINQSSPQEIPITKTPASQTETTDISTDKTTDTKSKKFITSKLNIPKYPIITTDVSADKTTDTQMVSTVNTGQPLLTSDVSTDKQRTDPRTELRTYPRTTFNVNVSLNRAFSELSPLSQRILEALFNSCIHNMGDTTKKISGFYLSEQTQGSIESVKRTIRRLMKENFIDKVSWKDGRGGWTIYRLHPILYSQMITSQTNNTSVVSADITTDNQRTQPRTTIPSSSSNILINNKNTTSTNAENFNSQGNLFELPQEWMDIDASPLTHMKFGINQITQLYKTEKISADQCQQSIHAFAWDLEKKLVQVKTSPLNFFMGVLRKGEMYISKDPTFKTPQEIKMEIYNKQRKAELERLETLEEETKELELKLWLRGVSKEDAINIVGHDKIGTELAQKSLKQHFVEIVWPEIRMGI